MKLRLFAFIAAFLTVLPLFGQRPGNGPEGEDYLLISKQDLTLQVIDAAGNVERTYPVAVSRFYGPKERRGDNKTPEGRFTINEILNAKNISHDFHDGKGPIKGAYGPWFLRLDVPGFRDIGIHGTHLPQSIGTRATEGCIRLRNEDIVALKQRIRLGMTVIILPDAPQE